MIHRCGGYARLPGRGRNPGGGAGRGRRFARVKQFVPMRLGPGACYGHWLEETAAQRAQFVLDAPYGRGVGRAHDQAIPFECPQ